MNPLGVLQGGVFAILAEVAAESMVRCTIGENRHVRNLSIRYLAAGRNGPIRTTGRLLRDEHDSSLVHIELRDTGSDDLLVATSLLELGKVSER